MSHAPARVLWVRGDAEREPLGTLLHEAGFLVRAVGSAFEAFQLASWPDLILLDGPPIDRPAGEVYQRLRETPVTADIPVLLLCRGDCPAGADKAFPVPCACCTPEPEQLVKHIEALVDCRRSEAIDGREPSAPLPSPLSPFERGTGGEGAEGTDAGPSVPARWTFEALGVLAVGVAHDFKNLLTVILGHAALVSEHFDAGSPARELLLNLETAATRAGELANQVLTFARKQPVGVKTVRVNGVVEETVRFLRRALGRSIECAVDVDACDPTVRADPGHLTQVLLNLCLNARDAMPQGGRLAVSTSAISFAASDMNAHPSGRPGRFVSLRVADTGAGIAPEVHRRLFELFYTTKSAEHGSGVGLSTVQRIVQHYSGWIECTSKPGCGACFDVYLPQA